MHLSNGKGPPTIWGKNVTPPLCMNECRPKMKGWLFVSTMGGPDAARTWARMHLLAVFWHMKLKVVSVALERSWFMCRASTAMHSHRSNGLVHRRTRALDAYLEFRARVTVPGHTEAVNVVHYVSWVSGE